MWKIVGQAHRLPIPRFGNQGGYPTIGAGEVSEIVTEHERAHSHRAGNAGNGEPGSVVPRRLPGMPDSPEAIEHSDSDCEGDKKNEPAIWSVVGETGTFLPSGHRKPEDSKQASC